MTVSRASFWIRRRGVGVTSGPNRRRSVAQAIAVIAIHGSASSRGLDVDEVVPDEEAVPAARLGRLGEPREPPRVRELPEGGDEDRAPGRHAATVPVLSRRSGTPGAGRARRSRPGCCAGPPRTSRRRRRRRRARSGSCSTATGAWKAVRIFVGSGTSGSIAGAMPQGALSAIGNIFRRATLSSCSARARRRPLTSTGIESGPPTVAIGTIGTPALIAIRTKPLRPARIASSRRVQVRSESISPPGHSATSWPAASAAEIESGAAGSDAHAAEVVADHRRRHRARRARCRAARARCRSAATTGSRRSTRPRRTEPPSGCRSAAPAARAASPSPSISIRNQ